MPDASDNGAAPTPDSASQEPPTTDDRSARATAPSAGLDAVRTFTSLLSMSTPRAGSRKRRFSPLLLISLLLAAVAILLLIYVL